jgi:DNA adenine methylase
MTAPTTPKTPLAYYGGKQSLAQQILAQMPNHRTYLEPFAGGAAVLFAKPIAERETINDKDGKVMAFWRAVRDRPDELARALDFTPYGRAEWRFSRSDSDDDVEIARRLLVEVDQSFSRSRQSWSPPCHPRGRWQPKSWANLPGLVIAAAERLRMVALEEGDALALIRKWDRPDAVIYCDPPYAGVDRRAPGKGYGEDDAEAVWDALVPVLAEIKSARVLLSGYPCAQAEELGWEFVDLSTRRRTQARPGDRLPKAPERLWLSPTISEPGWVRAWNSLVDRSVSSSPRGEHPHA